MALDSWNDGAAKSAIVDFGSRGRASRCSCITMTQYARQLMTANSW
jgi:hypothetical protein